MANVKISELSLASTPLTGAEELPVVQSGVTYKTRVADLIVSKQDVLVSGTNIKTVNSTSLLGSGDITVGTVTSVSALTLGTTGTDLSSTVANGTTTPVITLNVPTASATNRGVLSSSDWTTFNNKQNALVSGTNIKTINGSSVLGSGDLSISGGISGIHSLLPIASTEVTSCTVNSVSLSTVNTSANWIYCHPYIPNQSITTSNLFINVQGGTVGGLARVAIYSDLNGLPNNQLYISSNLDCSTSGNKTALTTFNFLAGVRYWLVFHSNAAISISAIPITGLLTIKNSTSNGASFSTIGNIITFSSGTPNPIPSFLNFLTFFPFIGITKA